MTETLLLDDSAWARLADPALAEDRVAEIADSLEAGRIAACLPFLLAAGYSARNAREHADVLTELLALPYVCIDERVEQRALDAQRQLTRAGHHALPPVDLLTAALAAHHRIGILQYDHDYDILQEKTELDFDSVWLAPRGTL